MDNFHLTQNQLDFYRYIVAYKEREGIWPTYAKIQRNFGWKSPNSVTQNIQSLIVKGYLKKDGEFGYTLTKKRPPETKTLSGATN